MNRNSLLEMSGRVMHMATRFTLNKGNALPMMQELAMDFMNSEGRKAVEHIQSFGFTSTPLPRDEQEQGGGGGQQAGQQGGVGGGGEQMKGPAAEGIALFLGGQRNHPVVIAVDDRRHRPMGLKPGENAQYDDIGQMTLLRRTFSAMLSLDSKDEKTGKMIERFVSLRHVEKKKQERPKTGKDNSASQQALTPAAFAIARAAEEAEQKKREDYKHEGDEVNTEMRASKSKVEFRTGNDVVGHYDKGNKEWKLTSGGDNNKSVKVDNNHAHIKIGENSIWVDNTGCWSTKPIEIKADPNRMESGQTWIERMEARITALEARIATLEAR